MAYNHLGSKKIAGKKMAKFLRRFVATMFSKTMRDSFAKQEWGTLFFVNKIVDSSQQLDLSRHRYDDCDYKTENKCLFGGHRGRVKKDQHVTFAAS